MLQKNIKRALKNVSRPLRGIWPRLSEATLGLFAFFIIAICLLTFSPTLSMKTSSLLQGNRYLALADGLANPFRTRRLLLKSGLPVYDLKIKRQQYVKIERAIAAARKQGWMSEEQKVWANAQFIYRGEVRNVKVRVRGDLPNHWTGPKKSWRIKFGKEKITENGETRKEKVYFNGQRQINLIIPIDRRYALSYFVNSLMRDAGLVVPRDRFVILRINGTIQGLYYQVEHFDKPLLAFNRRPETTVFGQDDRAMHFEQYTKYGTPIASDARFDIGTMRQQVESGSSPAAQAMQVLIDHARHPTPENFRRVRAVLDWDKYLKYRNLTTLFNTNHVRFGGDNFRLYFDPSRGLLEPIPWDLHVIRMPREPGTIDFWNSKGPDEIQRATLLDPQLRLQRNRLLWQLVGDGGDSLIARYRKIHQKIRPLAWADVLATPIQGHKMDLIKKDIEFNIRRVYKVLSLSNGTLTYRLLADTLAALNFASLNFSGLTLSEIQLTDSLLFAGAYRLYEDVNRNEVFDAADTLVLAATAETGQVDLPIDGFVPPELEYGGEDIGGRYWEFFATKAGRRTFFLRGKVASPKHNAPGWKPPRIRVRARNAVSDELVVSSNYGDEPPPVSHSIGITAYDASAPFDLDAPELTRAAFLRQHPAFAASLDDTAAVVLRGRISLRGTTIIPKGVYLVLEPGTELLLQPDASILSYGGLRSLGTPSRPVAIHGVASGEPWGVIAVVRAGRKVVLQYTDISGGGRAIINAMLFTGGIAVHDTNLEMAFCRISHMQSEDGLNLKNGKISMRNCLIEQNASDGVDIDFGTGEVRDSKFVGLAGDGLDLSGSMVTVSGCTFENIADKGVSVGENSHPVLFNNLFIGCDIGVSSKDLSHARVANSTFVNNRVAIEAKRKKPMFGAGSGEFVRCVFARNQKLLTEDYFSRGRVEVTRSLVDRRSEQVAGVVADVRFVAEAEGDFTAQPVPRRSGTNDSVPAWAAAWQVEMPARPGVSGLQTSLRKWSPFGQTGRLTRK